MPVATDRIASDTPGRVRLRLPSGKNDVDKLEDLRSRLHAVEGVARVSVRHSAGSVLVHYDPTSGARSGVIEEIQSVGFQVATELEEKGTPGPGDLGTALVNAVANVNSNIGRTTGLRADLRTIAPFALAAWGIYRLAQGGWTYRIPGYLFLYWAFDLFWKTHVAARRPALEPAPATA